MGDPTIQTAPDRFFFRVTNNSDHTVPGFFGGSDNDRSGVGASGEVTTLFHDTGPTPVDTPVELTTVRLCKLNSWRLITKQNKKRYYWIVGVHRFGKLGTPTYSLIHIPQGVQRLFVVLHKTSFRLIEIVQMYFDTSLKTEMEVTEVITMGVQIEEEIRAIRTIQIVIKLWVSTRKSDRDG